MSIPGSLIPLFNTGSSAAAAPVQIERSLRFNSSDSAYLSRTPASAGNRKTWTWAGWVKRAGLGGDQQLFYAAPSTSDTSHIRFDSDDTLHVFEYTGSFTWRLQTSQVFRDVSAWYHILIAVDSTQATASNRVKIYVNGSQVTAFSTASYPSQNTDTEFNNTVEHAIGRNTFFGNYFSGYLADIHFIDGQALDPSSFTEVSATTGQLIPKAYTGSFGTNGFWLPFSDNSAATATTLGKDYSGNGNNWTPNNISVGFPVTQNYSTTTTGTAPTPYLSTSYYYLAFNGDTSTGFLWNTGTWAMNWTSLPSAVTVSSSLRIYCYPRLGTLTVNINGNNVASITGNTIDWRTISFTGTINTISFNGTDTYAGVYAIEVNGAILIDPRANSVNDSLVDTPTSYGTDTYVGGEVRGNYATWNPLNTKGTLTNGNLDGATTTTEPRSLVTTLAVSSGKWYTELTCSSTSANCSLGVSLATFPVSSSSRNYSFGDGVAYYADGTKYVNGTNSSYGASYATNDVIGVAIDFDNNQITFYKNGSSQGAISKTLLGSYVISVTGGASAVSETVILNAGQRAFAYTAPSGFKALCDTNLISTTITTSGSYTGNGTADGPFVYLNGVPTAMTIGGNAVTFGTHADKLSNGFKIRTSSTTYNQNASSYSYSITSTGAAFKNARAQPNP